MRSPWVRAIGVVAVASVSVLAQQGTIPPPTVLPPIVPTTTQPTTTQPTTPPVGPARPVGPRPMAPTARSTSAVIIGQVVDGSGRGVPNAAVRLIGDSVIETVLTDPKGRFLFKSIPPSEAIVTAQKFGYFDGGYGKRRAAGNPLPFTISTGQVISDMRIEVFRGAVITGSIVDEAGEPVVGARVVAQRRQFAGGAWQYLAGEGDVTDDEGFYRIFGLRPGEYLVQTHAIPATDDDGRDGVHPIQFYPATEHRILAMPLTLAPGDVRYAVNFQLPRVPARLVTGRLIGEPEDVANQRVRLVLADTDVSAGDDVAATVSRSDGTFAFRRVPAGRYRLEAGNLGVGIQNTPPNQPEASAPAQTFWGRTVVSVSDEDVETPDVLMRPTVALSGHIVFERPSASAVADPSPGRIQISINATDPSLPAGATMRPDRDGDFSATNIVPGDYFVRVGALPPGWFLKSVTAGTQDAMDDPIDVQADGNSSVVVTLTTAGTEISGSVRDGRLQAVAGATVIVLPVTANGAAVWTPNRTRETRASTNGVFFVSGLPPGDYLIVAIDDAAAEGWQDPAMIAKLRTLATRITLGDGERKSLELRLR